MGRRQIRLRMPIQAPAVQPYLQWSMDVQLQDGQTLHGILQAVLPDALQLADHSQMWPRRPIHERQVPLASIREITLSPLTAL